MWESFWRAFFHHTAPVHIYFSEQHKYICSPPIVLKKKKKIIIIIIIKCKSINPSQTATLTVCPHLPVLHRPHLPVVFLAGERTPQRAENLHEHDHQQHNDELQSLHRHLRVPKYIYVYFWKKTKNKKQKWLQLVRKNSRDLDAYSSQITSKWRNVSSSVLFFFLR